MAILKRKANDAENKPASPADTAAAEAAAKVNETLAAAAAKPVAGTSTTVQPDVSHAPTGEDQPPLPTEDVSHAPEGADQPALPVKRSAPASVPATSLGTKGLVYSAFENRIQPMEFGALPRIKASGGFIMDGDNRPLGSWVKTQLLSWNYRYCISPNQDGAPSDLAKFSVDNETIDNDPSLTVAAHLQELKNMGYTGASSKKYAEIICVLLEAEKTTEYIGELVQLQLSPTMHPAFLTALNVQTTFKILKGLLTEEQAELLSWHTEPATSKKVNKSWTKLVPTLTIFDK